MHLLHLTAPVDMGKSFRVLPPGEWIVQDQNAFEIALSADRGTATLRHDRMKKTYYPDGVDSNSGQIFLMRSGAIGDLLLLTPAIKAVRIKFPHAKINLSCFEKHWDIFRGTGLIDNLLPYPLMERAVISEHNIYGVANVWQIFSLENIMELATDIHATDAFARDLGVTVEDYKPIYVVTDQEKADALAWKKEFGTRPLVGIQLRASTRNRDYPAQQWAKVITGLEDAGWAVILFGQPGQIPPLPPELQRPFIHDASNSEMSLRESVSLLSVCDAFVGVDSAFLHFCHALDIPAVGLFAAFDWKTRTSKAPLTRALSGHGDCSPCSWLGKLGQHFPPMPCRQKQLCSVLADIQPERIIAAVQKLKP